MRLAVVNYLNKQLSADLLYPSVYRLTPSSQNASPPSWWMK